MGRKTSLDPRPFIKLTTDIYINAKLNEIDDVPAAGWTYVTGMAMSKQAQKDGLIQPDVVMRYAFTLGRRVRLRGRRMTVAAALIKQGLWHAPGYECVRCTVEVPEGYALIHDFLQHQQSAQDYADLIDSRVAAGRKGGAVRWGHPLPDDDARPTAPATAPAMAPAMTPAVPSSTATALAGAEQTLSQQVTVPSRRAASRRNHTLLPDYFPITVPMREWAGKNAPHVDPDTAHQRFLAHYRGVGQPRADWNEVWRGWMLNDEKRALETAQRAAPRRGRTVYSNGGDPAAALRAQERARG